MCTSGLHPSIVLSVPCPAVDPNSDLCFLSLSEVPCTPLKKLSLGGDLAGHRVTSSVFLLSGVFVLSYLLWNVWEQLPPSFTVVYIRRASLELVTALGPEVEASPMLLISSRQWEMSPHFLISPFPENSEEIINGGIVPWVCLFLLVYFLIVLDPCQGRENWSPQTSQGTGMNTD